MTNDPRRRAAFVLLALAGIAALLALWALLTGGFRVHVFGVPLSVRGEHRAVLVAAVLAAIGFLLIDRGMRMSASAIQALISGASRSATWMEHRAPTLLAALALAAAAVVLYLGVQLGVRSAGGSDPSGYVSEAILWRAGNLHVPNIISVTAPWPDAAGTLTPLGYRPAAGHTIVPTYAPGLPLLMALSMTLVGDCGPFLIGPLCAAMLVWATYLLGVRVSGHGVGAIAALGVAASPTMLFMSMSAMSDVPAAAFWTASLALACRHGAWMTIGSAVAAGAAIMIRPNLAPLALFPMLIAVWPPRGERWWAMFLRAAAFVVGCLPAILFIAWVFNDLYGSPLESGYGRAAGLFSLRNAAANVARYPRWFWETQGPVPFACVLAPLAMRRVAPQSRALVWLLLAFIVGTFAAYAFYEPFDAWWFLRFLLPAFAPVFVLAFAAPSWMMQRSRSAIRRVIVLTLAAMAVYHGVSRSRDFGLRYLAEGEQKYADAGRFAAAHLPPNAIVLSMQHSGSVRLYSGLPILRYDLLDPAWLDAALEHVRGKGYVPYLLMEDWELDIFTARFARQRAVAVTRGTPLATSADGHVLILEMTGGSARTAPPQIIERTSGSCGTRVAN